MQQEQTNKNECPPNQNTTCINSGHVLKWEKVTKIKKMYFLHLTFNTLEPHFQVHILTDLRAYLFCSLPRKFWLGNQFTSISALLTI